MPGLIGKKVGMTSVFTDEGKQLPCTVIEGGPCVVTQIKTEEQDGYNSVQIAFDDKKEKNTTKPLIGHFKKAKTNPKRRLAEFKNFKSEDYNLGDQVTVDIFENSKFVDVSGYTKGKGYQGVVKRHGFSGVGEQTHGQKDQERAPGSVGGASDPSRVFKGLKMAGQTGGKKVKMLNLQVIKIDAENNLLLVKGCVPGAKGSYLIIND